MQKYICLKNPHNGIWYVFEIDEQKEQYAPNYGCPITQGDNPKDAIYMANMLWGIKEEEILIA